MKGRVEGFGQHEKMLRCGRRLPKDQALDVIARKDRTSHQGLHQGLRSARA